MYTVFYSSDLVKLRVSTHDNSGRYNRTPVVVVGREGFDFDTGGNLSSKDRGRHRGPSVGRGKTEILRLLKALGYIPPSMLDTGRTRTE